MESKIRNALIVLLANLILNGAHGLAHGEIPVILSSFQSYFVGIVIVLAPILAIVLVGLRRRVAGGVLLSVSMVASLIFGIYYHFLAAGSDNVASVGGDALGLLFRITAVLLVVSEVWGSQQVTSYGPERDHEGCRADRLRLYSVRL